MDARKRRIKQAAVAAAGVGLAYLVWSVWFHDPVTEWLRDASAIPFFIVMAVVPILGVPITPFFVVAGATFGTRLGVIGSMLALAANLLGCYVVGQKMRPRLAAWMRRLGHEVPDDGTEKGKSIRFVLGVKFAPGIPTFLKNYGLVMAGVGFPRYFVVSMLVSGAYGVGIVVLGKSLYDHDLKRIAVMAGVIVGLAVGVRWWRRRPSRRLFSSPKHGSFSSGTCPNTD
ncbi:MAG: hypothetical protein HOW73_25895 [Polyangiaceae bacterium]|nr:hypothetical protein [Polyangiaceae bacterium]